MSKKIFVTDIDSVLLDLDSATKWWFSSHYGREIESPTCWDYEQAFGIPVAVADAMWEDIWKVPLKPFVGAHAFLKALKDKGYIIMALSSRKEGIPREASIANLKTSALWNYFTAVDYVSRGGDKGEILKAAAAHAFLDDSMKNIYAAAKAAEGTKLFLWDKPWNQSQDIEPPYTRVRSYQAVLGAL